MKKVIKKAVTVELSPAEMIVVITYQHEHSCSRMEAIRALIRGASEKQRLGKDMQLLGARIDSLYAKMNSMVEILQQVVSAIKDVRLGTAFNKIAIEELHRDDPVTMERVKLRYEIFKRQ